MTFCLNEGMLSLLVRVILIFHLKCKLFDIPEDLHLETTRREHSSTSALVTAEFLNVFATYICSLTAYLNHTLPTAEVM